jgi:hypothetical protein
MKRRMSFYEALDYDELVNDYQFVTQIFDSVKQTISSFGADKKKLKNRLRE